MCEYCEKQRRKYPNDKYGVICPQKAGRYTRQVIAKVLKGKELSEKEKGLFNSFVRLAHPTWYGIPLQNIPKGGLDSMITTKFGKKNV